MDFLYQHFFTLSFKTQDSRREKFGMMNSGLKMSDSTKQQNREPDIANLKTNKPKTNRFFASLPMT
jgi:hypothetical protein